MPVASAFASESKREWRTRDLVRAVVEIAQILGWQVFTVTSIRSPTAQPRRWDDPAGPSLLLIHRGQHRLVLARIQLRKDVATGSSTEPSLLAGSQLASDDGFPTGVETHVWGVRDILDGSVGIHLDRLPSRRERAA